MNKKIAKLRRAKKTRAKIRELKVPRLTVHRSSQHIYAQIFSADNRVVVTASTVEKDIRDKVKKTGNILAATEIGKIIGERAKKAGIVQVAFDRAGNRYHGRVKALAEAARESGLEF